MASLFSTTDVDALFNRIHNLRGDAKPRWGTLTPASMLQHCRIVTEAILLQKPSTQRPGLKQWMLQNLVLGGVVKIPRGRPMPSHIAERMAAAGVASFEAECLRLHHAIEAFASFEGRLNGAHPHFGRMSHPDWGRFAWVHLDHHLRQFGV